MSRPLSALLAHLPRPLLVRLTAWRAASPLLHRLLEPLGRQVRGREVTIRHGAGAGLRIDTTGGHLHYGLGLAEPEVQHAITSHLRCGDAFYDVGANIGFFTLIAAQAVGAEGHVLAFEPAPQTAVLLERNVRRNAFDHVVIVQKALADAPGTARFIVPATVNQEARLVTHGRADGASGEEVDVEVTTLDELVREGAPPPALIKMDVEGAEVAALAGMSETLRRYRPVVLCEVHGTRDAVTAALREHGYTVRPLTESEGDLPETDHVLALPA